VLCCAVLPPTGLALRCYRRAVAHGDREGIGIAKLVSKKQPAKPYLMVVVFC